MNMTVAELIEELEAYPEDAKVKLAYQPSWPMAVNAGYIGQDDEGVVYIGETGSNDYLPGEVSREFGWK